MFRKNDKIIVLLAFLMGSFVYANAAVPEPIKEEKQEAPIHSAATEQKITTFEPIYFLKNQSVVVPKSFDTLNEIVSLIKAHSKLELIEIEGYTDASEKGPSRKLSKQRAEFVKMFLVEQGIEASQLKVMVYGSTKPKSKARTEEGRAKNRRVEFSFLAKGSPTPGNHYMRYSDPIVETSGEAKN